MAGLENADAGAFCIVALFLAIHPPTVLLSECSGVSDMLSSDFLRAPYSSSFPFSCGFVCVCVYVHVYVFVCVSVGVHVHVCAAISFASGLAATAGIIHCLEPNSHVIVTDDVYGGTQRFFRRIATQYGHTFSFVDFTKEGALEEAFQENTRVRCHLSLCFVFFVLFPQHLIRSPPTRTHMCVRKCMYPLVSSSWCGPRVLPTPLSKSATLRRCPRLRTDMALCAASTTPS